VACTIDGTLLMLLMSTLDNLGLLESVITLRQASILISFSFVAAISIVPSVMMQPLKHRHGSVYTMLLLVFFLPVCMAAPPGLAALPSIGASGPASGGIVALAEAGASSHASSSARASDLYRCLCVHRCYII
jgi:hypothetical protein